MDIDELPRIKSLPPLLANQIAAGEVIENPASVIKELVENAIDASANHIEISLIQGGLEKMTVRDNGCGILADDLPLALTRHATSKLANPTDLFAINSMGFRGEALASIAAVSKLTITSRPKHQEQAWSLRWLDPHTDALCVPAAHPFGTSVTVAELFYNTPVRRKFLRSARTELLAIETIIKRLALAHPNIAFKLKHNDKLLLDLACCMNISQKEQRLTKLLSSTFLKQSHYIDITHHGLTLEGYFSSLNFHRNQHDWIFWSVNQRPVRDKLLLHAFKQVYANDLPPDRYPSCVLNISLDPKLIDVNIHPTKHEIRFRDSRLVHDFIVKALTEVLHATNTLAETSDLAFTDISDLKLEKDVDNLALIPQPNPVLLFNNEEILTAKPAITALKPTLTPSARIESSLATLRTSVKPTIILHQHYLWLFTNLVHVINLKKAVPWLLKKWMISKSNNESKSLLFPLRIHLIESPIIALEHWQALLSQFNIVATVIDAKLLLINQLPEVFRLLDLNQGLIHLFKASSLPDSENCLNQLCEYVDLSLFKQPQTADDLWNKLQAYSDLPRDILWEDKEQSIYQYLFNGQD